MSMLLSLSIKDSTSAKQNLEKDLLRVAAWCCTNNLLINADKTKLLPIGGNDLHSDLKQLTSLSKFKGDLKSDFFLPHFILLFNI